MRKKQLDGIPAGVVNKAIGSKSSAPYLELHRTGVQDSSCPAELSGKAAGSQGTPEKKVFNTVFCF